MESAHDNFKTILETKGRGTQLTLKELAPVLLIKNKFYQDLVLYEKCQQRMNNMQGSKTRDV
jgi:enoyl-[acyl-carrier protein] reductase II